jgi:hypothetical protein
LTHLIGDDFLTIDPGEAHWQNRDEFLAGAEASANYHGKLIFLALEHENAAIGL